MNIIKSLTKHCVVKEPLVTLIDGNYRGISLLSIAGKILARILLNRILPLAEEVLPESQCGFRPTRGTTDMVFVARLLQEK